MVEYRLRTLGINEKDLKPKKPTKKKRVRGRNNVSASKKAKNEDIKNSVIALFNRKELYVGENRVDNSDKYISNALGIRVGKVSYIISKYLKNKTNSIP